MEISVQELRQKLAAGDKFVLIDVRQPWEYEEFNLGGELIPVNELINRIWELEDYKEEEVVVCCRSGSRSAMAQGLMLAQGFKQVRNLKGGLMAWVDAFGATKP